MKHANFYARIAEIIVAVGLSMGLMAKAVSVGHGQEPAAGSSDSGTSSTLRGADSRSATVVRRQPSETQATPSGSTQSSASTSATGTYHVESCH